ncbi:hypothetical protein [Flavobacterium lipolyticum]|uniref:Lipoprotein n=1 Tax=Flavobacterium lipolyticum TaxID=2893754 RepID=A0ABS8LV28_9FLAO|nr:hypothetical protein [Flavobacterium sp. F-126]MCC9016436.1 hypothetical protein [Flavobacterium sp. F-126]
MKRLKEYCLLFFFVLSIIGCKDKKVESKEQKNYQKEKNNLNFDKVLKMSKHEYMYDTSKYGSFFTTSYDYGVLYAPENGNDLGNLVTFLIPKDFLFFEKYSKYFSEDDSEKLEAYVNKLSIEEYKKVFDIYVFFIDKKFLIPTPHADCSISVKEKYKTDLYHYKNNSWEKMDSFEVDSDEKVNEEMHWKINFVEKKTKDLQKTFFNSIAKSKIEDSWYRDYILSLDSYESNYNYTYYIKVSKDSCYFVERDFKDLLVPVQKGDTLFLYHRKNLLEDKEYINSKHIPEVKIVKLKDKYYVNSPIFNLKESITTKPLKYGFISDEIN